MKNREEIESNIKKEKENSKTEENRIKKKERSLFVQDSIKTLSFH